MSTEKGSESAVNQTSRHTPKPWLIEESRSEVDSKCIVANGSNLAVVFFRTHEEQANAKLIAAAPDMLEALKEQHNAIDLLFAQLITLDNRFLPTKSGVWDACVKGNAAIAKAEGK